MPTAAEILNASTLIAHRWLPIAVAWHLAIAIVLVQLYSGRITKRSVAAILAIAMASVSVMAWSVMNPVNGTVFALLAILQGRIALRLPATVAAPARLLLLIPGAVFAAFGWLYPHFLPDRTLWTYAYAAPMGLLPCPTLLMAAGLALMAGLLETPTRALVGGAGLLYGLIGVFVLGVTLDWVLLAAAVTVVVAPGSVRCDGPNFRSLRESTQR
jgi:hypothetical protein